MAQSILEIILKTIRQGQGIPETEKQLTGLENATKSAQSALGMLGLAFSAQQGIQIAKDLSDAARAANDARGALIASTKGAVSYEEAITAAKEATRGMVSEQQLANSLTTIFGSNLASNAEDAAKLAAAGTTLVGVFESAGASMDLFTRYLNSGSRELSNNFGVSEQLIASIQRQIEASGQAAGNEARILAVRQAVVETAKQYQAALTDDSIAAAKFEASLVDAKAALGQFILPEVTDAMQNFEVAIRGATDALDNMSPAARGAVDAIIDASNPLSAINALVEQYQNLTGQTAAATDEAAASQQNYTEVLNPTSIEATAASQRELTEAIRETTAAQQAAQFGIPTTNREADAYRQMAEARGQTADIAEQYALQVNQERIQQQRRQEEQAARESERTATRQVRAIAQSFDQLGPQIASAVSGAIGELSEVWNPGGETDSANGAAQWARRMAAIAAGGVKDEWANPERWADFGGDKSILQPLFDAIGKGDDEGVKAQAKQLLANKTAELFDANMIAQQVEQKLRAQQLKQQLDAKVNQLLGEKGIPAVTTITQQVGQAATDTSAATGQVSTDLGTLTTTATEAGNQINAAFGESTLKTIDTLNARFMTMLGLLDQINNKAGLASGNISAMNPPNAGANANGTPSDAARNMGGQTPL